MFEFFRNFFFLVYPSNLLSLSLSLSLTHTHTRTHSYAHIYLYNFLLAYGLLNKNLAFRFVSRRSNFASHLAEEFLVKQCWCCNCSCKTFYRICQRRRMAQVACLCLHTLVGLFRRERKERKRERERE